MKDRFTLAGIIGLYVMRDSAWSVLRWRWYARHIRDQGGEDAVRLGTLLRQATVWAILTFGSGLVLAGAVIALIHDA